MKLSFNLGGGDRQYTHVDTLMTGKNSVMKSLAEYIIKEAPSDPSSPGDMPTLTS